MGKAAKKKKLKIQEDMRNRKPELMLKQRIRSIDRFELIEDAVLGILFFSVALLFSTSIHVHFTLPKLLALRICSLCLVVLWIVRLRRGKMQILPSFVLYAGAAFGLWLILSTFFALHLPTALHGVYGRYNALINNEIYIVLFFLVATLPMDIKRISRITIVFVFALVPVSFYAILQYLNLDFFPWPSGRSASTIGNPVILGALLSLGFPFALVFFLRYRSNLAKTFWGAAILLLLIAMFTTISRGPALSIIISSAIIFFINKKEAVKDLKKIVLFAIPVFVIFTLFILSSPASLEKIGQRLKDISNLKSDSNIQVRLVYYKAALEGIKEYPLMGAGLESFRIVYPRYRPVQEGQSRDVIPTMVHNGYLQLALTNGIPALMLYLSFLSTVFIVFLKKIRRTSEYVTRLIMSGFIGMTIGYLFQDLTGWMEIALTPFFWILIGAGVAFGIADNGYNEMRRWKNIGMYIFLTLVSIALMYLVFDAINRIYANRLFWQAEHMSPAKDWKQMEYNIKEGLAAVPGDFYHEDMAGILYLKRYNETGEKASYEEALRLLENAHRHNPYDIYVMIHRVDLETVALKKGLIQKPSSSVEKLVSSMLDMDKNNPSVYESAIKLRLEEKKYEDVLKLLEKARTLHPEELKYYILEGNMHRNTGNVSKAIEAFRNCIKISEAKGIYDEDWLNAKHNIAIHYLNKKDFNNALKEAKEISERMPNNVHPYNLLGDIYGISGNFDKARESFASALRFDPGNQNAKRGLEQIKQITGK
jgi:putative inorganic carbon (HCO3(-)) transporter